MKNVTRTLQTLLAAIVLSAATQAVADENDTAATVINNVGYLSVIDKPQQCSLPKLELQQKQFKNKNLTVYLTVENSKDGSHWIIGQRKFLKDPRNTPVTSEYAAFAPVTTASIACEQDSLVSGL